MVVSRESDGLYLVILLRNARLTADVFLHRYGRAVFTWGGADVARAGDFRQRYIEALRAADSNDIQPLLVFARA
jgi:hypothetical protein